MKFCPYCGAGLEIPAASFCPECGRRLPGAGRKRRRREPPSPPDPAPPENGSLPEEAPASDGEDMPEAEDGPDPYDGYYDDVLPPDTDSRQEGLDKELAGKIALVSGSVLLAAVLCIALLYFL